MPTNTSKYWNILFDLTHHAEQCGEVPVAALITHTNTVIAKAHNLVETHQDATQHAEMLVIKNATQQLGKYLNECDLYVSLEPCPMCAHAIRLSQIRRVYFGAYDPENGAIDHGNGNLRTLGRLETFGGFHEKEFSQQLTNFFSKNKRRG